MHQHSFTLRGNGGLLRQLIMPVTITIPGDDAKKITIQGLWDTGASTTVITKNVVDAIGLVPVGKATVHTASETVLTDVFLIDLFLKHDVKIQGMNVTLGKLTGIDCLIGMDIINIGDFSITNYNGTTCMSFGLPSKHEVDYVKDTQKVLDIKQSNAEYMKKLKGGRRR